jgi:tetratricopeptide (TPR) repeat protein
LTFRAGLWLACVGAARADDAPVVYDLPAQSPRWLKRYRVRWPLRVTGTPAKLTAKTIITSLPTGGWLKADAADVAVQTAGGKVLPVRVLSHDPAGETIIQFQRHGNDAWYWAYGVCARPLPQTDPKKTDAAWHEGLSVEVRAWAGDDLKSWARVRDGLRKSSNVIGNALVAEVIQSSNPVRPDRPRKFAASYRGFLTIPKEGVYRFFVNSDDASFLFIDGFKVCERVGTNQFLSGTVKLKGLGVNVNLKAGIHPFEVHHVVGDGRAALGRCTLHWMPPGQAKFAFVPRTAFVQAAHARVADLQAAGGKPAAAFAYGNDDLLDSAGVQLYLVRLHAQGHWKKATKLTWDFGDGTTGAGPTVTHVYFKGGPYRVTLRCGTALRPFRRSVYVWPAPGETSPLSLLRAVRALEGMRWQKLGVERVKQIFAFLLVCGQSERWRLLEAVARHLLAQDDLDLQYRAQLWAARIEALASLNRAKEALRLAARPRKEFARVPGLRIQLQLAVAAVYQDHLKDLTKASKLYKAILDDNRRVEHPNLRLAAVRWGDLHAEVGDYARASKAYRLAAKLGGDRYTSGNTGAATRGALMRIAEQKLRAGNLSQARQLLERIELEFPGRRLDGLYCFLRGETGRQGGRYEDAIRHYEILRKLPQWAGYRDRALFGIADCLYRQGKLKKALALFDTLKKNYPKFFARQKGDEVRKLIKGRLARIKAARAKGDPQGAFFRGVRVRFERGEEFGRPLRFAVVRAPGMRSRHVGLLDAFPTGTFATYDYSLPVKDLTGGGTYWVELWYRVTLGAYDPLAQSHAHAWLAGPGPLTFAAPTLPVFFEGRTLGGWRKLGFKVKAPLVQDGFLMLDFKNVHGIMEIDALTILPVSDRQNDSLASFNEAGQ